MTVPGPYPDPRVKASAFWRMLPAGMNRRWWLFRPFDLLARHFPVLRPRKGVLVVRMDGIGDMVLFRASLERYAEAFGVARGDITVLGCHSWAPIADAVFAGYRVVTIDEHAYARRPLYRLAVNLRVRALAPAVAVCDSYFRRALMADSLVWVSGAPSTVVSLPYISEDVRAVFTYYLSQATRIIDTGPYPTHEVVRHDRFLSAVAGHPVAAGPPAISWREQAPPLPDGAPYLVLNPGSNEFGRRWPLDAYAAVGRRALAKGLRVVIVGAGAEKQENDAMARLCAEPGVIDLVGRTNVPELLDVLKHAACVLTNDTGPAHLAIALGAPTVVVIGGGHYGSFVPYPDSVRPAAARFVAHAMDCYHCFWRCPKRATKYESFPCVVAVSEDDVWAALEDVLAQAPQRRALA